MHGVRSKTGVEKPLGFILHRTADNFVDTGPKHNYDAARIEVMLFSFSFALTSSVYVDLLPVSVDRP